MHFPVITPSLSSLFQRIDHGASAMFAFLGHRHHANGASAIPNPTVQPVRAEVNTAQANNASVSGPPISALQQDAIQAGRAVAVSDGSHMSRTATLAWCICANLPTDLDFLLPNTPSIVGTNQCPGNSDSLDSFRAKLAGIYAIVAAVRVMCIYFCITNGKLTLALDGLSALHQALYINAKRGCSGQHYDLINSIRWQLRLLPIQVGFRHVKAHQDQRGGVTDSWQALNVEMDALAQLLCRKLQDSPDKAIELSTPGVLVSIHGHIISKNLKSKICTQARHNRTLDYWKRKFRWDDNIVASIDWKNRGIALKQTTLERRRLILKHSTGMSSIGTAMVRFRLKTSAKCPQCDMDEDEMHIICCQGVETEKIKSEAVAELESNLTKCHTCPLLIAAITDQVQLFSMFGAPLPAFSNPNATISNAVLQQNAIGLLPMLLGFISTAYHDIQQEHCSNMSEPNHSRNWGPRAIDALWTFFWTMWKHRNFILHTVNSPGDRQRLGDELNAKICLVWDRGRQHISPDDRSIFHGTLMSLLCMSMSFQTQWLATAEAIYKRTNRQLDEQYRSKRAGMKRWLQQKV